MMVRSEAELAQRWVIVRTAAQRPPVLAIAILDLNIVDARDTHAHKSVLVELPVLVAVGPEPVITIVVPLVGEPHRDAVLAKCPDFLDQPIVKLTAPFAHQKRLDC